MKRTINLFTATYADNINKHPGMAFVCAIRAHRGVQMDIDVSKTDTYMTGWMRNMASLLDGYTIDPSQYDEADIFIHTWTPNLNKMCKKMQTIYDQLKDFDEDVWLDVVPTKLRRANRQYYEYHDDMVTIMLSMLRLNKQVPLNLKFKTSSPHAHPEMLIAWQKAEKEFERSL